MEEKSNTRVFKQLGHYVIFSSLLFIRGRSGDQSDPWPWYIFISVCREV